MNRDLEAICNNTIYLLTIVYMTSRNLITYLSKLKQFGNRKYSVIKT